MGKKLFYNARFLTLRSQEEVVEALAVQDGRIVALGSRDDCESVLGTGFQSVDLLGYYVIPGLTDSHIHFAEFSKKQDWLDLSEVNSLQDTLQKVAQRASVLPAGSWLLGSGWTMNNWQDVNRPPTRRDLDNIAPDHLVALFSRDFHSVWVNTLVLERAGISRDTSAPPGGEIARDESGEPTGWLLENAQDLIDHLLPDYSQELPELIAKASYKLLSRGITSIHDFDGVDAIEAYKQLSSNRKIGFRVYKTIPAYYLETAIEQGLKTGHGDEWFKIGPVKFFSDGALGSRTAAMLEPYLDDPSNTGIEVMSLEELKEGIYKANNNGIACAIHAIGDRANRNVLDAFKYNFGIDTNFRGFRNRIEHVQHLHPNDLPRLAQLGIIASMQPIHCISDMMTVDKLLGDRGKFSYAWKSLLAQGTSLAFGSDCPVETLDPFVGIYAAVTRRRHEYAPNGWYPEERISVYDALRAYTFGAAYASGEESIKGVIDVGMLADFAVVSCDPLHCDPEALPETKVLATYVGGEEVYTS